MMPPFSLSNQDDFVVKVPYEWHNQQTERLKH